MNAPTQTAERQGLSYAAYLHDRSAGLSDHPSEALVQTAAGLFDATTGVSDPNPGGLFRRHGLTVSPGTLVVRAGLRGVETPDAGWQLDAGELRVTEQTIRGDGTGSKSPILSWSKQSRLNMARTLAQLDWNRHLEDAPAGWSPAMLTLTMPGDWLTVAPDRETFNAILERFYSRWFRAHGRNFEGSWKLEFQRRGAPHVHTYGVVPKTADFRVWLSIAWTSSVFKLRIKQRDGETWPQLLDRVRETYGQGVADHLRAGTGIDWRSGIKATNPRAVAMYFLGKSIAHNLGKDKEYQHIVPAEWLGVDRETGERVDESKSAGRFWGYRGMVKLTATVELDDEQFFQLRRLARRWSKSHGRYCRSSSTGRHQGFTLLLPDAPTWLAQASRWDALSAGGARDADAKGTVTQPSACTASGSIICVGSA